MKRVFRGAGLAAVLILALACTAAGKSKAAYTNKKFDLDGVPGKDKLEIQEKVSENGCVEKLSFQVNGKETGSYDCSKDLAWVEGYELLQSKSGDVFLLVSASEFEDYSTFLLFSCGEGKFTCCLKGADVIEAKAYLNATASLRFVKGEGDRADEFWARASFQSKSLGYHNSMIYYEIKDHRVVKKSRVYKTKITGGSKVLTLARKTPAFAKCTASARSFYFRKGDKVKATKLYDNPRRFRIYIKRVSDGKAGWINGIANGVSKELFEGVGEEPVYD